MTGTPAAGRSLFVRADSTPSSGTGHLMRCLALAQAWIDLGGVVRWYLAAAPEPLADRVRSEGIEACPVHAPAGSRADGTALADALDTDAAAVAVVDGYRFEQPFLGGLGPAEERLLYVDDLAQLPRYDMRWVLNQNAHADRSAYPADASATFLLGLRYVALRREFRFEAPARPVPPVARRLLVTFGGQDPAGMTLRTIRALRTLSGDATRDLEVRVVVGAANRDAPAILAAAATTGGPRLVVRHAVTDMPAEIQWADLAVTSGGTTVWELARYGCPALMIETVPAETTLAEGLRAHGLFDLLGHESTIDGGTIRAAVAARLPDAAWRGAMRELGRRLVDGNGARRVALALAGDAASGDDERGRA